MCGMSKVAHILAMIGAINWGLVGAFDVNLVNMLLGSMPVLEMIVYILVGLSGIMMLVKMCKCQANCKK